eukprot:4560440-Alexandrium_andersonii.AAC.1
MQKFEGACTENPHDLFYMDIQLPGQTPLPACLQDPDDTMATLVFTARAELCGNRMTNFVEKGTLNVEHGTIDMSKGGCYELKFEGDRCKEVVHIAGPVVAVPPQ